MPRPRPVRTRREFHALSRSRCRGRAAHLWVARAEHPDGTDGLAVAYAIGRSVGSAVVRNRLRRRLRALMTERGDRVDGLLLIGVSRDAADLDFSGLAAELDAALDQVR